MRYNICIIQPKDYVHTQAYTELAEAIKFSLIDLGFEATLQYRQMEKNAVNILIGCHLLELEYIPKIPKETIILNTEQIYNTDIKWNSTIFEWVKHFRVWDYSERNILKLNELGIRNVGLLKLGFQKELIKISNSSLRDIDVLFYGWINPRRAVIIDQLKSRGLVVRTLWGIYGEERDALIARSKLVLNHHFHDSEIFEVVRVFYLMINSIAVVSEINPTTSIDKIYIDGVSGVPYNQLANECVQLVQSPSRLEELRHLAFKTISRFPQSEFTKAIL